MSQTQPKGAGEQQPGRLAEVPVPRGGACEDSQLRLRRLTRVAARATGAPLALAVLPDEFGGASVIGHEGSTEPWASLGRDPRVQALGTSLAGADGPSIVTDARSDTRLRDHPALAELGVGAYVSMPLRSADEQVGSLCLIDSVPREWASEHLVLLQDLADSASAELELERVVAEHELVLEEFARSDARYRSLVSTMTDGVVMQDRFGVILECNPAAEHILGLTADQMTGRSSLDRRWRTVYPDGREMPGVEHPSVRSLETGKPLRDEVIGVHKPTGELTWISISTEPLLDSNGDAEAVVVTFTDVTTRKRTEALREQQLLEQEALRALATLVSSGASPQAVFAAAARHGAQVLGASAGGMARLEADTGATLVGAWIPGRMRAPGIGSPIDLEAQTATATVLRTGRAASRQQPTDALRRGGIGSSFATPILVAGQLWGALSVAYDVVIGPEAISDRAERLGRFAELVSMGISGTAGR